MANGKEMINELNYRRLIEEMPAKELSRFTALQTYENNITLQKHERRLVDIESLLPGRPSRKRQTAFGGTILTAIALGFLAFGRWLGWWS